MFHPAIAADLGEAIGVGTYMMDAPAPAPTEGESLAIADEAARFPVKHLSKDDEENAGRNYPVTNPNGITWVSPPEGEVADEIDSVYAWIGADALAAQRAAIEAGNDYGPRVTWAALVPDAVTGVRRVLYSGPLSAVRQALPDETMLADMAIAGCTEYVTLDRLVDGMRVGRRVAIADVVRPLQIEYETRGLAAVLARFELETRGLTAEVSALTR